MPIRFRCDTCRGKLSIATRKIGTPVECPRCNASMVVPIASQIGEKLTVLLMSVGAARYEAEVEANIELAESVPRPRPVSRSMPKPNLSEMPLFERADFDTILESSRLTEPKPLPLPDPIAVSPGIDPNHHYDSIFLSRTNATLLAVAVVVSLGVAFGAGYVVRGFAIPTADAATVR